MELSKDDFEFFETAMTDQEAARGCAENCRDIKSGGCL